MERLRDLREIKCPDCGIVYVVTRSRYNKKNKVPLKHYPWLCFTCNRKFLDRFEDKCEVFR